MCPGLTIFVFIGDNKRKDYASVRRRGETRAREKATSFLCFARENLQCGDHFIFMSNGAARCFCVSACWGLWGGLEIRITGNYGKL